MNALRIGPPITVEGVTLIPIERLRIVATRQRRTYWFNATKELVALVICEPEGPRAVDVESHPLPLYKLIAEIPELQPALAKLLPPRPESVSASA